MTRVTIGPDFKLGRALLMGKEGQITAAVRRHAASLRNERPGSYRLRLDVHPLVQAIITEADIRLLEKQAHAAVGGRWYPELLVCVGDPAPDAKDFTVALEALPDPSVRGGTPAGATVLYQSGLRGASGIGDPIAGLWLGPVRFQLVCTEPRGVFTARFRAREGLVVGRQDFDTSGPLQPIRTEEDGATRLAIPTTNNALSRRAFSLEWSPTSRRTSGWTLTVLGKNPLRIASRKLEAGSTRIAMGETWEIGPSRFHVEEEA